MQIKDPNDSEKLLGANETGEICVKNVALMKGYLNRKKANDEFMDSQGFAHTGDLGYYDDDGVMHYVDRLKALMKYAAHHMNT